MQRSVSSAAWAAEELATANFGDARLNKRLIRIVTDKLAKPTASIPQASGDWAATKATYRFFASHQVRADAIRAPHRDATVQRILHHPTILVLQDTTELDYTGHPNTTGLGHLDNTHRQGLKVHSGLAATIDGVPLGLLHQAVWTRDAATKGIKRRNRPQAEKESQRWLTTLAELQQVVPATTRLIVVADREADIYPLFIAPRDARTELVVRATYDRGLVGGESLEEVAVRVTWQGTRSVTIPGNGSRAARTATVHVGWSSVQMLPPTNYPKPASAPRPQVHLVVVEEREPPPGVKPLRWLLWTTLPVESWDEAVAIVEYYRHRWLIERYHFVLKSGCGIEELQLETGAGLERALAVCCVVAWRLLWLTYQARRTPDEPCTSVFATHEWQALYCTLYRTATPPAQAPTLHEAMHMVARLGGFLARKGDGEPGVKTIWRGLVRLDDIAATWLLARGSDEHQRDQSTYG
jgi:Transposase DNA-binding/Transposase Tn5 dimerisation domain